MRIDLKSALSSLPLPATTTWPEGVWDKTVFSHGTKSVLVFTPRKPSAFTSASNSNKTHRVIEA
jgi:hypothetical protein